MHYYHPKCSVKFKGAFCFLHRKLYFKDSVLTKRTYIIKQVYQWGLFLVLLVLY